MGDRRVITRCGSFFSVHLCRSFFFISYIARGRRFLRIRRRCESADAPPCPRATASPGGACHPPAELELALQPIGMQSAPPAKRSPQKYAKKMSGMYRENGLCHM